MSEQDDALAKLEARIAALTARVYQLEKNAGIGVEVQRASQGPEEAAVSVPASDVPKGVRPQAAVPSPPRTGERALAGSLAANSDLEKKIGQYWLNRIGIVAMLFGVSYFLKYAFDNNWIGAAGRIVIGLLAGIGVAIWGEQFRRKGYAAFSYSLKAVGIGTLYLSLWGAFQVYRLIPSPVAFAAMCAVTGATIVMALAENAELLATFALAGGFATPLLLSTGENHEVALFVYLILLDLGVLALAVFRPWRRLLWGSFAGTIILYFGWSMEFYHSVHDRPLTVFFAAAFAAIFAAVPLLAKNEKSTRFGGPSLTLTLLPLLNAGVFFVALYQMYSQEPANLTWYALALGAIYLGISSLFKRRYPGQDTFLLQLLHVAIAVAFVTVAIPLKLEQHWITIGWLIESAVLLWIAVRVKFPFLRWLAVAALCLGLARLLFYDQFHTHTLIFNARFATYLIAIAILAAISRFGSRDIPESAAAYLPLISVLINILALIMLTSEASAYFQQQLSAWSGGSDLTAYTRIELARDFSYSAIWLAYGVALMAAGFRRRSALIRWQSLILIAVTIVKVFVYDVSALDKGYRILSFVALGVVLLAISFVYQRNWLDLLPHTQKKAKEAT